MYNGFMTEQRSASKLYPDLPMLILRTFIAQEQPLINAALTEATAKLPGTVIPIARYALGNGGKRLRPLLTILMARLLGYDGAASFTDEFRAALQKVEKHYAALFETAPQLSYWTFVGGTEWSAIIDWRLKVSMPQLLDRLQTLWPT